MKKKKGPLILIGVLVLLLILYFALSTWNKKQDSKEEETVKVTDLKTSEITGGKYDLGTGEMNLRKTEISGNIPQIKIFHCVRVIRRQWLMPWDS